MTERVRGMDLAEFLLARIAEDVDTAEHVVVGLKELPHEPGSISFNGREVYDLRRVTRELEAKQQIVAIHQPLQQHPEWVALGQLPSCAECGGRWPCETLRVLATVYADHPDYRDEWRP